MSKESQDPEGLWCRQMTPLGSEELVKPGLPSGGISHSG